jgi:hypothetical protein
MMWRTLAVATVISVVSLGPTHAASAPEAVQPSYRPPDWDYEQEGVSNDWDWKSLERLLPDRPGDFILPYKSIEWQVYEALGVAPLHARALPDGRRLLWGCRRHSCDEKAAIVVSPEGKVEAAALLHARCRFATTADARRPPRRRQIDCDTPDLNLTVFVHVTQTYRPDFERWAAVVISDDSKLRRVEIFWV